MRGKQDHSRERMLRHDQTEVEQILWQRLRDRRLLNSKFRRQRRVGPCYVDFHCADAMLVVELDGSQHLGRSGYDERRTRILEALGYRVQRYWNDDVFMRLDLVLDAIALALEAAPHPPCGHLLPARGEKDK